MTISMHVDGHVAGGHLTRVAIAEIRSITIANMPFVNVATWTITFSR